VKLATWKKLYPQYAGIFQLITSPDGVTVPNPIKKIEKELVLPTNSPYKKIVLMVGTDRYEGFKKWMDTFEKRMKDPVALAKYGGTQDQVSFDTIAIPRGAALGGVDTSFTQLRNVLKDTNLKLAQKLEVWKQGFGNKLDDDWVKKLMMLTAKGMGIKLDEIRRSPIHKKVTAKVDKYYVNFNFADGPVYLTKHLLERLALRELNQKDMLDILFSAKKVVGEKIKNLSNVDFVIKRKDGLGYGIKKILQPDDSYKYVITTAHDEKNYGKYQTRYFVESDELNVHFHNTLNPVLFDSQNNMSPAVRSKLLKIAEDFKQSIGIGLPNLKDITVSGSNAAYTYTPKSDIDLHLIVDLPKVDNDQIYRELFDAKKFQYNEQHDFKIKGYDVELYVQNANEEHISQGIYSVLNDAWVKKPQPVSGSYDEVSTRSKYDQLKYLINKALVAKDYDLADKLRRTIKKYRQVGLHSTGEFGPENLAFKALRTNGYIKKLYDLLNDIKDKEFSLESHDERLLEIDMSPARNPNEAFDSASRLGRSEGVTIMDVRPSTLESASEEQLNELANQPYPYKVEDSWGNEFIAKFKTEKGLIYRVRVDQDVENPNKVGVSFEAILTKDYSEKTVTKTNTGDAFRIFATVGNILKIYLQKNPKVNQFYFSGNAEEPSRLKLYDSISKMIPKILSGWKLVKLDRDFNATYYHFAKVNQSLSSLKEYIEVSSRPFIWQKEEPKKELTEMQKACILGGHEYTGELK
jgi:sulfur relay (sulfurtransferase) DsrC/TusE family protein